MRFLSHTWRPSLALAALIVLLIGAYFLMAKRDFEADKTATVLESQRLQVKAASVAFDRLTERALFDARAVLAGYNDKQKKLNPATQNVFWENPNLLAIEFTQGTAHVSLEKLPGFLEMARSVDAGDGKPKVQALGDDRFAAAVNETDGSQWRVIFEGRDLLPATLNGQVLVLSQRGRLLKRTPAQNLPDEALRTYIKRKKREPVETRPLAGQRYMISSSRLGASDVLIAALTPVSPALAPVNSLFTRGLLFVRFAFFLSLMLATVLSRRLQTAFAKEMQGETALRVQETAETTRRQTEEKSAALVADHVFPQHSFYRSASLRLAGPASTELSGQWWFYFQRGYELFVFTAATHEAAGALLLPACRALFSNLQNQNIGLKEIARLWDKTIYDCSKGSATMRAQLLQINVELGSGKLISAGHSPVLQYRPTPSGFQASALAQEQGFALGEMKDLYLEKEFDLQPGTRLLLGVRGTSPASAAEALYAHRGPHEWIAAIDAQENLVALDFKATRS